MVLMLSLQLERTTQISYVCPIPISSIPCEGCRNDGAESRPYAPGSALAVHAMYKFSWLPPQQAFGDQICLSRFDESTISRVLWTIDGAMHVALP